MSKPSSDIDKMIKKLKDIGTSMEDEVIDVAKAAVELIKKRTRLGFGVKNHGDTKKKLKPLSKEYRAQRKRNKPTGPTTAGKSNLTKSGDMLDDLKAKKKDGNTATIEFDGKDSQDKAEWVSDDRPFNKLSKAEQKQLTQMLDKKLKKLTKKE